MFDFLADGFAFFAVGAHEFVVELEIHPDAGGDAEEGAQALSIQPVLKPQAGDLGGVHRVAGE